MVNAYWEPFEFVVQEGRPSEWQHVVDTAQASRELMSWVDAGHQFHIRWLPVSYA